MNTAAIIPSLCSSRAFQLLAFAAALLLTVAPALAKRGAPKPVQPVVAGAVEYSAPHELMGFVVATDTGSRKELWRVRIYSVKYLPDLEKDVQDVFITSLVVEGGALIVTNEKAESFTLDLSTRKVIRRK